eukprot:10299862-Heterocapsa_arctica.AAC.1
MNPAELLQLVENAPGCSGDFDTMIAILEMLAYVVLVAVRGAAWRGLLVIYVTDNQNTKTWLIKRRAGRLVARHLLRILARIEARFSYRTEGLFVRTYHNTTADWMTREMEKLVETELMA